MGVSWIICSKLAYLRPNLLHMGKLVLIPLFLLVLLARRSGGGPAGARAPIDVLLFLFGWFEDLGEQRVSKGPVISVSWLVDLTWKEQSRLSSTLIIAPALSNSPQ